MGYLYRHIRLDKNEVFYIGIGGFNKRESKYAYTRAYENKRRNKLWNNIVSKTEYDVEIILDDLSWEEACEKEKEFVSIYGRINLNNGTLANLTDGGDGASGRKMTDDHKNKIRMANKGRSRRKSIEEIEKIKNTLKGRVIGGRKKGSVMDIDIIILDCENGIFYNMSELSRLLKVPRNSLNRYLNNPKVERFRKNRDILLNRLKNYKLV